MKNKAFTVAEVLITLSIIGVVSAFVLPSVSQKYEEQVTVSKLKQAYSELSSSYQVAINRFGPPQYWGLEPSTIEKNDDGSTTTYVPSENLPYERILTALSKKLIDGKVEAYQPLTLLKTDGLIARVRPVYRLTNGVTLLYPATVYSPQCTGTRGTSKYLKNVCGDIKVDINGPQGPNILGHDVFVFYYTKYGLIPIGLPEETTYHTLERTCNMSSEDRLNGYSCTAWIINKGNMAYLKRKISW